MLSSFLKDLKQFFNGYSVQTRKQCQYCGGGRCMGICGGGLAKLSPITVQGILRLNKEDEAVIEKDGETVMVFDPSSHFGRMIMKKCQLGESCQIKALAQGIKMERLISAKKLV
ncbi:MAG: hypothetical protein ACRCWR_01775 [Saezia sp.]